MYWKSKPGYFFSQKNNKELRYRSQLERKAYEKLENDMDVLKYTPEPIKCIPYCDDGTIKCYKPDILIFYKDGKEKIIEVKPENRIDEDINRKKCRALKDYCKKNNFSCDLWTEKELGIK